MALTCIYLNKLSKGSKSTRSLSVLPSRLDERSLFCVYSFKQKLVVVGGNKKQESVNTCMACDSKINKWIHIASMNTKREDTPVQFFEAKLLLLGGWIMKRPCIRGFSTGFLRSVETYSLHENNWTQLPDML